MSQKHVLVLSIIAAIALLAAVAGCAPANRTARGQYLVEQVAMCIDCHTPRTESGELDRARWLSGSKLDFQPIHPIPGWADSAPELAGLRIYKEDYVITLLATGKKPDGTLVRPPMPSYRMSREDAAAVAAYLGSLKPY